jgi:cell wall-associated NlpC family hydrolase
LACAAAAVAAGCATTGGVPRPFPGAALPPGAVTGVPDEPSPVPAPPPAPPLAAAPPEAPAGVEADAGIAPVLALALGYRGVPYRNGGSTPEGFDCSGLVQYVFAQNGVRLPREVRDQYGVGQKIDRDEVQPGDLVFFETVRGRASHVGIALGDDQFVHAPSSRGVVRVERYTSDYWDKRWLGARRVK